MTNKTDKVENKPKTTAKKVTAKKEPELTLYQAVQENPAPNYIIVGALSKAGLLAEFEKQRAEYERIYFKPSITASELNEIIKDFTGE